MFGDNFFKRMEQKNSAKKTTPVVALKEYHARESDGANLLKSVARHSMSSSAVVGFRRVASKADSAAKRSC